MAFWVVRAGKHGVNEGYVVENNVVAIGWEQVGNLSPFKEREALHAHVAKVYPNELRGRVAIWAGELWALKERIKSGDHVAVPLTSRAAIAIGRVTGPYYVPDAPLGAKHQRKVEWLITDLPRSEVDQDLLYTLGSTLAVFQAKRNNAEERLLAYAKGQPVKPKPLPPPSGAEVDLDDETEVDLEQFAADKIVAYIGKKFLGHELARLVGEILKAEGYQILVSKPGADGGVDILAGTGPMGFGQPRIAVQVKSGATTADVGVLRELQGVMPRFGADHGLIVSWAGFNDRSSVKRGSSYFEVRLWDSGDLVAALQNHYAKLPEDIQAELPLKRIWLLVDPE